MVLGRNDSSFDVSQAVNKITVGAAKGANALKQQDPYFNLADALGKVTQSAASNLSNALNRQKQTDRGASG